MNVRIVAPRSTAEAHDRRAVRGAEGAGASRRGARPRSSASRRAGLPTRRVEAWHYTDLRAAMRDAAPLAPRPIAAAIEAARALLAAASGVGDGVSCWSTAASSPPCPTRRRRALLPRAAKRASRDADGSRCRRLNDGDVAPTACAAAIRARRATRASRSRSSIAQSADGALLALFARRRSRSARRARDASSRSFLGAGAGAQRNAATTLMLAEGAKLEACRVVARRRRNCIVESQTRRARRRRANSTPSRSSRGGALTRRQIFATLGGRGREDRARRSGAARRRAVAPTRRCRSITPRRAGRAANSIKHIVADEATGVFQGKVIVAPGAQKTDGAMKSQAVLLSPHAQMNNKPELEIFADDVRLRPRRDRRRARPRADLLSAGARPAEGRGRGDAARGLRRRGDRPRRGRGAGAKAAAAVRGLARRRSAADDGEARRWSRS